MHSSADLHAVLKQYWGYDEFRPRQEQIITSLLDGRDVAVVMPTGGGKSLCYQLPAVVSGRTVVVISPLIALMEDQAVQMNAIGVPSAVVNSSQGRDEQDEVMGRATHGAYRLLYISPERLARSDTVGWLRRLPIAFFVVDEAHCISEWGHEFRPEYRQLSRLRDLFPEQPIAAFTASATLQVRRDILLQLRLRDADKHIVSFHRPNLRYLIARSDARNQKTRLLAALKEHDGANVIVYAPTIRTVEDTLDLLAAEGIDAVAYHGQMDAASRKRNQERWMSDDVRVLVGTIAFGLGINKPAVRAVIHLSLPKSIEQYYQEAGRAGRDGLPADCLLLWQGKDAGLLSFFIQQLLDADERERSWRRYHTVRRFVEGESCRHLEVCRHFGENPAWEKCGMCDVCEPLPAWLTAADARSERRQTARAERRAERAAEPELMQYLREWRREAARRHEVPAYVILHDSALAGLCDRMPANRSELLQVEGIGARKAELYGAEILAALDAFAKGERAKTRQTRAVDPLAETKALLAEGHSLAEVAEARGRQLGTVVSSVATLIERDEIELDEAWLPGDHRIAIFEAIDRLGDRTLRPLKDALPEEISYDEIKLAIAERRRGR